MSKGRIRHQRKVRRQIKAMMLFGPSAKPTHKSQSGRTGSVHSKREKAK